MALLKHLRRWLGREETPAPDAAELALEEEFKARLRERCARFHRLLSANKPFGMDYVRAASTRTVTAVFQMVRELNALSGNSYAPLQEAFERVRGDMERLLALPEHAARGPLIRPLADIRLADLPQVGGKMANLGELAANVGLDVPDGFAVTVAAYYRFMEYNGLRSELERRIQATDMRSLDEVFSLSAALQQCVLSASLPPDLEAVITEAVAGMKKRAGDGLLLALRSSAVGEDALGVTFAGQYRSELNVPPEEACEVWKEIVASKYAVTAMSYRYQRGIPDDAAPMSVGVLAMVRAEAGGVAYSRDPVAASHGQERVLLNAVPGLPQSVVDGTVTPDVFVFSRENPPRLLEKHPADATRSLSLTVAQAARLARVALALEEYYNEPQDVEWALEAGDGRIMVLQSRPLREADGVSSGTEDAQAPQLPAGLTVLARGGVPVSPGVGMGPAFVARKEADMLSFPQGGVLVVERAYPRWATLLSRASGLVSETGGMAGHLRAQSHHAGTPCGHFQPAGRLPPAGERRRRDAGRQPQRNSGRTAGPVASAHDLAAQSYGRKPRISATGGSGPAYDPLASAGSGCAGICASILPQPARYHPFLS